MDTTLKTVLYLKSVYFPMFGVSLIMMVLMQGSLYPFSAPMASQGKNVKVRFKELLIFMAPETKYLGTTPFTEDSHGL